MMLNPMANLLACLLVMSVTAFAGESGDFIEEPNLVGKITESIVTSKIDQLTPRTYREGDKLYSYHLKTVSFLGTIKRGSEKFILATAFFVRSSAQGRDHPPARGHGFLLCLSPSFHLTSHCRLHYPPDVDLVGAELRRKQKPIWTFTVSDLERARGFLIDGDDILPYPFSDKLINAAEDKSNGEQATRPGSK